MQVERYEWEDALVEAHALGILPNGCLLAATKLAHAINWKPKDGGDSSLRWMNDMAFEVVGLSRSTYYKWAPELRKAGFLTEKDGNIHPLIPANQADTHEAFVVRREAIKARYEEAKSVTRTLESVTQTEQSVTRTPKSVTRNPYSVDTYTDDSSTVDSYSGAVVADAPTSSSNSIVSEDEDVFKVSSNDTIPLTTNDSSSPVAKTVETEPKSVTRTVYKLSSYDLVDLAGMADWFDIPRETVDQAVELLQSKEPNGTPFRKRAQMTFKELGVYVD